MSYKEPSVAGEVQENQAVLSHPIQTLRLNTFDWDGNQSIGNGMKNLVTE
jgi:hypothetical protein